MQLREDILTPKERVMAFLQGRPIDRALCMPIVTSNTVKLIGKTIKEYQLDAKVMADAHIAAFKKFKYDLIYVFTNCSNIAEAMGQEIVYPEDEPANTEDPIIKSREDLAKLKVAEPNGGFFQVIYDAVDILNKEIGDEVFIAVCFSGPVSTAGTLRGTENFARDTYADPELCHELLRISTDSCKVFMKEVVAHGAMPILLEPIASGSLFSPKMFQKFAFPYIKELVDYAHELKALVPLHICGKTHKIVDQMADTGADVISIDVCALEVAKEKVGGKAVILGNVSPANEMLFGPAEVVHEACIKALDTMKGYKPGYILSTGCETPVKVPFEHIEAMMDVARSHGVYDFKK